MGNDRSHIIDQLPGLVWTAHPDGSSDFVNQRWAEYTGLSMEEASGPGWQAAVHPEDRDRLIMEWDAIIASRKAGSLEARLRRFDGEYRWFHFRASPLTNDVEEIIGWCGINTDIEDRRQLDEGVLAQKDRYRVIVDGLPAVIVLMTPEGQFGHANRHMREYIGATQEEMQLPSRPLGKAFHPEDRPGALARWFESIKSSEPYDYEARLRRADGVYRWFHTLGYPLRDADGKIVLWYLLQTDIDDKKRAEDLLTGEKRLLEMVARGDSSSEILNALCRLVEGATDGCICSVMLADLTGKRVEDGAAPSLPDSFMKFLFGREINTVTGPCGMATFLNEQVISDDLTAETRWPSWCPTALEHGLQSCWSTPIRSTAGKALGAFAIYHRSPTATTAALKSHVDQFTHIASIAVDRVQRDAALKRSEALLSQAQRLSSTGSFGCFVAADEHFWSDEAFNIFGYDTSTTITFQRIVDRVVPDDVPVIRRAIKQASEGQGCDCELRLAMPDGALKHVHIVAHGVTRPDRRIECFGAIQDVTARRLSEEALGKVRADLAHASRVMSLGTLTASIAHEVNQPLSGIITNASTCLRMLGASPPNIDGAMETARRTIRDGDRANDVIVRLRALFAKEGPVLRRVDLNEAVREVLALSNSELRRSHIVLRSELSTDLPTAMGDRVQLQQVILNLLLNASDAMGGVDDRPRDLVIRTEADGGSHVRLSVRDIGVGLASDTNERLFEAFYTTKKSGMGIGLSVSRSIVESHKGRLWATPNVGPGATFSFSIPCESSEELVAG